MEYIGLFLSGWLTIASWEMANVMNIPGATFGLALPIWLIVKGLQEPITEEASDTRYPLPETVRV